MKRLFFVLLFFGALLLVSCQDKYGILDYQDKDITAECIVNEKFKIKIEKNEALCKITVSEPKNMNGVSFEIGERVYVIFGDTKIEVEREALGGICALAEIFSQSEDCLTTAKAQGQGSVLTFQKETCTYQITLGEHSLPKSVKILSEAFEYDIEICSIELK